MSDNPLLRINKIISKKPVYLFWFLQICFWSFVSLISLVSLTLWYVQIDVEHLSHTFSQSIVGIVFSMPLYWIFMRCWHAPIFTRVFLSIASVLIISFVWTVIRVELYIKLVGSEGHWDEFGGWFFSSIFIYFCWTGFFHGIRYYQLLQFEHKIMLKKEAEAKSEQLKRLSAQSVARDAKIKMLRYQLNPHFLCNTLNAINSLIECELSEKAQLMTVQLSKFLRYSLDNNPDTKIALEFEIIALNLYLEIEKTRFGERLNLDFQISEQAKSALIPSLLIQPIIENSMKHVIAKNEEGGTISLRAEVVSDMLVLTLSDTGSGARIDRNKVKGEASRGVGLRNIDERLKVLYADDYVFNLNIMPSSGLKTIIKLPFECIETKITDDPVQNSITMS
ncbi:sensor histidine kinase [Candidatus Colwellia aromaticivorans]|uniref:sensor histidine kinase n=1 Tax=Candidatus Colwellia aromaticivorans TaxID=2267621 RepID=UPI001B34EB29|nr:histidine kinase [Candidatus Colwellia aromaticivorans]